jgi:hypothetical protein
MAIKVFDVDGPKLPGHDGEMTQDVIFDTDKAFIAPGAKTFLAQITATETAAVMPEGVKAAVSTVSRATNKALNAIGLDSANLDFYGHPFNHPLGESYLQPVRLPLRRLPRQARRHACLGQPSASHRRDARPEGRERIADDGRRFLPPPRG